MATRQRLALFFGLAVGAFGQPTIHPSVLKLGAPLGSKTPVTASAAINYNSAISGNQDFDISIRYATPAVGWLTVTPTNGIAPATISLSADPSGLPEGTHSAYIVARVGLFGLSATLAVTLVVAPTGVNPGGLAVSPSSLTFNPKVSTDPQTVTVSNPPGVSGSIAFVTSTSTDFWVSATQIGSSSPGAVKVQAVSSGLSPGIHTAAVILTASSGKSTLVPVTILVPQATIGSTIKLTPAQRVLTFNFQTNSGVNPTQTVYITTDSTEYTYFTATATTTWLGVASASWITPASTATCFAPGLFYVAVNPSGLDPGVYQGSIRLEAPSVTPVDLPVTLHVTSNPVFNANPSFVSFDSAADLLTSTLSITASTSLFFTATVSGNTSWLKISTNNGVASANSVDLTLTATTTNLPAGTYSGAVILAGSGGQPTMTVPVELKVSATNVANAIRISPLTVDFSAVVGDSVLPQYVAVLSDLGALDQFNIAVVADGGWLAADLSAQGGFVKISVSTAGSPGLYSGTVVATSLKTGDTATAAVNFRLQARTLTVLPTILAFQQSAQGAPVAPQELQVTSNRTSPFRIAEKPDWVKADAPAGLTTPAKIVVTVNAGTMLPGRYEGNLRVSGPVDVTVPISLVIAEPPPATVSPSALSFVYDLGGPAPSAQSVTVSNPTGSVRFSAQVATSSGIDWLALAPSSGSTPSAIAVSINVARLTPGEHSGTVTIGLETTPAKVLTVPVSLVVRGAAVQVQSLLNAATLEPTAVSPGLLVTLTGLGLGPDTAVVARPNAAGGFGTQLSGVQVNFDGTPAPLLMVSAEQINAIAPYAVYGRASVKIQVQNGQGYSIPIEAKAVDAAPGIFTTGQGRGPAAALNADYTVNSVLNPAKRGTVVIIYLTGEGQTDPPGQDGRVINTDVRKPLLPVLATVAGRPAEIQYVGSAPGMVSGVCQLNLWIPEDMAPGPQTLEIQIGAAPTQRGVTISVQ